MFEGLAKFRRVAQWLKGPLSAPVRFQPIYSNDNRSGFCRPGSRGLRPRQALACHWFPAPDGTRLECRWELAAAADQSDSKRARPWHWGSPPLVPNTGQMTALEQIAI